MRKINQSFLYSFLGFFIAAAIYQSVTPAFGDGRVTRWALSGVSGGDETYDNATTSYTDVMSVSFRTTGRPVRMELVSTLSSKGYIHGDDQDGDDSWQATCAFYRGATLLSEQAFRISTSGTTGEALDLPLGAISHTDVTAPTPGTYTYKMSCKVIDTNDHVQVNYAKLLVYELP